MAFSDRSGWRRATESTFGNAGLEFMDLARPSASAWMITVDVFLD
jgi:hypothetical protein